MKKKVLSVLMACVVTVMSVDLTAVAAQVTEMPEAREEVEAYTASAGWLFDDVEKKPGNWKYEAVKYVNGKGLMGGVGGTTQFQPDRTLTRSMFATVLYRMAGKPQVAFEQKFKDVEAGRWYSEAIIWANKNGIVNGYSDGNYGIDDNITREQIAKMLNEYAKNVCGYDVSQTKDLSEFTDVNTVSGWATGYLQWAVGMGMISGKPNGDGTYRLDPKGDATRAECAAMLMRFMVATSNEKMEMSLHVDNSKVLIGETNTLTFYVETNLIAESIDLYDGTGAPILQLFDNGEYSGNGDEIAGDSIYTAKLTNLPTADATVTYVAASGENKSNELEVKYYTPISNEVLNAMQNAEEKINSLVDSSSFQNMSDEDKMAAAENLITELTEADYVKEDTVVYNDKVVSFEYEGGILGGIMLEEFDSEFNGMERNTEIPYEALEIAALREDASDDYTGERRVLILNAFPAFETEYDMIEYRTTFYENLKTEWDAKGVETTLDTTVTVDDYKTLNQYDVVCISTHGSTYKRGKQTYPAICLAEDSSKYQDKEYSLELKDKSVVKVGGKYWILPSFFEGTYDSDDLDNIFIFSETCQFMGKEGNVDNQMADALLSRSAEAVVGFHNSVYATYSRELMKAYVNGLFAGQTTQTALDNAKAQFGADHKDWYENKNGKDYDDSKPVAYPILSGDGAATIALVQIGLVNGDFEQYYTKGSVTYPKSWIMDGDVRSITQLGDVEPYGMTSKRMGIITTGVGSKSTEAIDEGTEGSIISQKFMVPNGVTRVSFDYNFVSEEPMEFVGTSFNDAFGVQILQSGEVKLDHKYESINESKWFGVDNINFPGGDSTVYQTGWKSVQLDVSAYQGQVITLKFVIYDVGDSLYDSVCLLDNVALY